MWKCATKNGDSFNIFPANGTRPGTLRLFGDYQPLIAALEEGAVLRWTTHPIPVQLVKDGEWWNVVAVALRPDDAQPDVLWEPDHALSKSAAACWAQIILASSAVLWDTETTGDDKYNDEIVSIAAVRTDGKPLLNQLIKPKNLDRLTQSGAGEVNGITAEALANAPSFADVYRQIATALLARPWVIYNAQFDTVVLERECLRNGLTPIVPIGTSCAMEQYARWHGEWDAARQNYTAQKLSEAAAGFGANVDDAHDALADCRLTLAVVQGMANADR